MTDDTKRTLGTRIKTVLDVDQTLNRVDEVALEMGPLLETFTGALNEFNATLERFGQSLDRFSHAAETIDGTAAKLDVLITDLGKTLDAVQLVTSPITLARDGVRRVRSKE